MKDEAKRQARDRTRPLRTVVNATERTVIEARAAAASLSVSAYLRAAAMGATIRPTVTVRHTATIELAKVNADQGRLGGLLKLWLTDRPGDGASVREVRALLSRIEDLQGNLAEAVARL